MVLSRENGDQAPVPPYWEEAKAELMKRDRIMNRLIPQFGDLHLVGHADPFITLARSIVNQQVTQKAGAAQLAACGLSKRKTEYILDLADHFKTKKVHANEWGQMDDEAVIAELV